MGRYISQKSDKMNDSPPGCSSSETEINADTTPNTSVLSTTPKNHRRRKRRGKKNGASLLAEHGEIGPQPSPHVPVTRMEKKAYKKDCVKRPKMQAPSNTTSFICDNNDETSQFDQEDDGFSHEYNQRLIEEYEGEKERGSHEENINKRHDYLKRRLDKANAELERLRPIEDEATRLRTRVVELEGEVMKLRTINRSQRQRQRTLSTSDMLR